MKPKQWNEDGFIFPPTEDKRCSEANCFVHSFEYFASDDQIQVCHDMNQVFEIVKFLRLLQACQRIAANQ